MKKMPPLLSLLFFFAHFSFAQVSGDVTADTTLANQLMEQAQTMDAENEERKELAKKAYNIYLAYAGLPKFIQAKGLYAMTIYEDDPEKAKNLATEAVELAEERLGKRVHAYTVESYITLMAYENAFNADYEWIVEHGTAIEPFIQIPSLNYFSVKFLLIAAYSSLKEEKLHKEHLDDVSFVFSNLTMEQFKDSRARYFQQAMRYHAKIGNNDEKAISYGEKALLIVDSTDYSLKISISFSLIHSYVYYFKNNEKAKPLFEEILKDGAKLKFLNQKQEAAYYVELAICYGFFKMAEESLANYQKALDILEGLEGDYDSRISSLYFRKGKTYYFDLKNNEKAIESLKKSIQYEPNYSAQAHLYLVLRNSDASKDQYEELLFHLQKSIGLLFPDFDSELIEDNPSVYLKPASRMAANIVFNEKAKTLLKYFYNTPHLETEEKISVLENCLESVELSIHYMESNLENFDGYENSFFKNHKYLTDRYGLAQMALYEQFQIDSSSRLFDKIYQYSEKRKVMSLLEYLTSSKLPKEIVAKEFEIKRELANLKLKEATVPNDSLSYYQDKLNDKELELDQHKSMIQQQYPKEANNFYNIQYANPNEIAAELDDETLFLSLDLQYFKNIGGEWYNVTVIGKNERNTVHVQEDSIYRYIWDLEKLNKNPLLVQKKNRKKFIYTCHKLYQLLFGPFEEELKGKTKLIIVQEGHFLRIPFDILLTSGEDRPFHELPYLIKQYDIAYQYSGTAYLHFKNRPPVQDGSMLAFAPVFMEGQKGFETTALRDFLVDSLHRSVEGGRFVPLPNSKKEVEAIVGLPALKDKHQLLLEQQATKENLLNAMEQQPYQFVHLASHGLVNMDNHRLSGLACWHGEQDNDALLFASEIQQRDIQADLVVLSSCESGVGMVIRGEGLIAMNRSFFYAGAKNVLFSLWKVNDQYTSDLMTDFYKNYFELGDYSAALRQAKLDLIADPVTANPRFWAPFVLIGE